MNYLKSLALMLFALMAVNMTAANVDSQAAQAKAVQFMNSRAATRFMASAATMRLAHAETSSVNKQANAYYVFNYDGGGYVIVAGDDRAEEILGYGDGTIDMNNIPDNMRWWLSQYKEQIDFLLKNPDLKVEKLSAATPAQLKATTISPMVTCLWDQESPYWDQCPTYRGSTCLTGCVATAMAQVMYYWKYPAEVPAIAAYKTDYYGISVSALPGTTLDWDSMTDTYSSSSSSASKVAVATLMRYCGQSCSMDYGPDGSGAYTDDELAGMKLFGYNSGAAYLQRSNYSDTQWTAMMLEDLQAGRPILYGGDDGSSGHAFVVDGYDGSKYHINWGWSGTDNGYFAISSFMIDSDYDFRKNQDMLYQIYPENQETIENYAPVMAEATNVGSTSFTATWTDQTPSENVTDYTLYVQAYDPNVTTLLTETFDNITSSGTDITSSLDSYCDNAGWTGTKVFSIAGGVRMGTSTAKGSLTTPALDLSATGGTITVKFNAAYWGTDNSTITVSCGNASQTVSLTDVATDYTVTLSGVTAAAGQTVTFANSATKKRFYIYDVEILSGGAATLKASESGDANSRVITGITSKSYTVSGLTEGGSYKFYVVANYTDNTKKESNTETVTLDGTAVVVPEVIVDNETLNINAAVGETATATIGVLGANLTGNVTLTLVDESGMFTISPATIAMADAEEGAEVTVTYAPTAAGSHTATVTVATEGANAATVTINGTAAMATTAPVMAEATNVGTTSFTATWTDATAAQYVKDYTLYVNKVGGASGDALLTETFSNVSVTKDGTIDRGSSMDNYCDNAGWTGYAAYEALTGGFKLGSGSKLGYITTPALPANSGTITVVVNANDYVGNSADGSSMVVSCGEVSQTIELAAEATDYTITLSGVPTTAGQQVTLSCTASGKRLYVHRVTIYDGAAAATLKATESGDADSRVITGITDKTYTVTGLTAGATYRFYVEANYIDDAKAQSNTEQVTLLSEPEVPTPELIVDATDNTLTMAGAVLGTTTATFSVLGADLTGDVTLTLSDETGMFTISPATITMADALEGAEVTVTYAPTVAGSHTATITVSSEGADDVVVTINATATMETLAPEMQPADSVYITTTSFRADWVDVTPEQYVRDYTLYVNIKQQQDTVPVVDPEANVLLKETFYSEEVPSSDSNYDIGNAELLDDECDVDGWTGNGVFLAGGGGMKLGSGSKVGYLMTPALDMTNSGGILTVKFNAKDYVNVNGKADGSSIIVSCGEVADTVVLATDAADYVVVLRGLTTDESQNVKFSCTAVNKRFYLYNVTILSGEETAMLKTVSESGDANSRVITGITDQYYVVEDLTPGATYTYYVEANYIDGTKAASNTEEVTLLTDEGHGYQPGDVNHDRKIDVADVALLIDYVLGKNQDACTICANVDGTGTIDVADVSTLISNILGK